MTDPVERHLRAVLPTLSVGPPGDAARPVRPGSRLTGRHASALFTVQVESRQLDIVARELQGRGEGFYTIGSAGHEGNAAVAAALRPTDPALLHYRSGGFYLARAAQVTGHDGARDVLLGLVTATADPISGGRHKVFGSPDLAVIPQTSTIGSQLPRALGVAFTLGRARRLGLATPWPEDAVVVTSFGDASVNHSTVAGALNAAGLVVHSGLPLPLLVVCEDNGWGISVPSPSGWVRAALSARPGLRYFGADGGDLAAAYDVALDAVAHVRRTRTPAVLHLRTLRLLGHAGSDAEVAYRTPAEIEGDYARDPLLRTAELLSAAGLATPEELLATYDRAGDRVRRLAAEVVGLPRLESTAQVMAPLAVRRPAELARVATAVAPPDARAAAYDGRLPEDEGPLTLALAVNRTLRDVLAAHRDAVVFGEDVGVKGGVYGVTRGLARRFGVGRVWDSVLDEQTILGTALGAAVSGLLPIPEIQYLAYLHNAIDQLRGEAATLQFFSNDSYRNGMVVRIAGLAYQKGFGGHFHNDNAVAALRDIPGLVLAVPARPDDAATMLRACVGAARAEGRVCVFLEPIALYHTRDLDVDGDGGWLAAYPPPSAWDAETDGIGCARTYGDGDDLTLVTFGNGLRMCLRVLPRLAVEGVRARVVDLRWLAPLPVEDLLEQACATRRVLVVDETRRSGGVSEGVLTALVDGHFDGVAQRVTSEDSFIPLGAATRHVLLDEEQVLAAALALVGRTG